MLKQGALLMPVIANIAAVIGNFHTIRGHKEKAEKYFRYALPHGSTSPQAHLTYGLSILRSGQAKEAAPLLDRALALCKPKKVLIQKSIRLSQASCRWALGDTDGAVKILERMRADYDYVNENVLSTLSFMYIEQNDLDKAEALSREAIEDTPSAYSAWDNLGQIAYRRRQWDEAKAHFVKALEFKEDLPDSLYYLGQIAREEGETEKAAEYFEQALACDITALNTVTRAEIEEAIKSISQEPLRKLS
jgi:tetratricopeptide (TPR) repeat protein